MMSYSLGLQNCPHIGETSVERNLQLDLNTFPVAKETALLLGRSTYSKWYCKSFSVTATDEQTQPQSGRWNDEAASFWQMVVLNHSYVTVYTWKKGKRKMQDKDKLSKEWNKGLNDTCSGRKKGKVLRLGNKQSWAGWWGRSRDDRFEEWGSEVRSTIQSVY